MKKLKSPAAKPTESALRKSELAYRTLVETSHDLIWSMDARGRLTFVNAAARRMLGYEPAEIIGHPFTEFESPEQAAKDLEIFARIMAGKSYFNYETVARRKDGTPVSLSVNAAVLRDEQGVILGTTGTAQDITARKQAEQAWREVEVRFRTLFERAPVGVVVIDPTTAKVIEANEIAARQLDYSLEEFLKLKISDFEVAETPEQTRAHIEKVAREGWDTFETRHVTKTGAVRDVLVSTKKIELSGRTVYHTIFLDITERKRAEDALHERERELRLVTNNMPGPISRLDRNLRYLFVNDQYERIFGKPRVAVVGHTMPEVIGAELFQYVESYVRRVLAGEQVTFESQTRTAASGVVDWLVTYVPDLDPDRNVIGFFVITLDITARKQSEEALKQSEERLRLSLTAAQQGLYDLNVQTGEATINAEYATMLGYDPAEFRETNDAWIGRMHPDDREPVTGIYHDYLAGRRAEYRVEFRQRTKQGDWKWILSLGSVIARSPDGRPLRMLGTHTDITERKLAEEALKLEQSLFSSLARTIPDHVYFKDRQSRFVRINDIMAQHFGLREAGEALGKTDADFFSAEHARLAYVDDQRVMSTGESIIGLEEKETWPDGRTSWVSTTKVALRDADGQITGLVGISRDITKRKQTEFARDRSLSLMQATLESTADGILVVNSEGKIETFNSVFARMWRLPEEVLASQDDSRALQWVLDQLSEPKNFIDKVRHLYAHPEEESFDSLDFKDGRVFERYSRPQFIGGKVGGRVWSFRDITERKRAEAAVRESEDKFRAVFVQSPLAIVLAELPEGRVADANAAAEILLGHKLVEVRGKTTMELNIWVDPTDRDRYVQLLQQEGAVSDMEVRLRRHDGAEIVVLFSGRMVQIGGSSYVISSLLDITERKHLEEHLRQTQKMEAIGQLSGGVAHDFNNLLTAIIGHLGLLRTNAQVTPEIALSLGEIAEAANRAANLTHQLLTFSRRQVLQLQDLDLNKVVEQMTRMLRRMVGEDIAMQVDYAYEPMTFHGDPGMMEQVLLNLAVNARDAMPAGGTLRIVTRSENLEAGRADARSGTFVHLSVSDTGTGIAPDVLPKIFEPFFTTKEVGKGTGLGLATVFGIVQQHQGWIEVKSALGHGTTFHLFLPKVEVRPAVNPGNIPAAPGRGRGETILLVEDEAAVREMGVMALSKYGYQVLTAASGAEALAIWSGHQGEIALLLTDLIMPGGMSGLQLARQLLQQNPGLRVVYSSGYSAEIAGKELPLKDGINYLGKPYELDVLFRTVRTALDGKASRPPF